MLRVRLSRLERLHLVLGCDDQLGHVILRLMHVGALLECLLVEP